MKSSSAAIISDVPCCGTSCIEVTLRHTVHSHGRSCLSLSCVHDCSPLIWCVLVRGRVYWHWTVYNECVTFTVSFRYYLQCMWDCDMFMYLYLNLDSRQREAARGRVASGSTVLTVEHWLALSPEINYSTTPDIIVLNTSSPTLHCDSLKSEPFRRGLTKIIWNSELCT